MTYRVGLQRDLRQYGSTDQLRRFFRGFAVALILYDASHSFADDPWRNMTSNHSSTVGDDVR